MITILASVLLPIFAQGGEVDLSPNYRNRPFLILSQAEKSLPPEQGIGLVIARAAQVCEFLKAPSGRFRRYSASGIQTKPVSSVGSEVAVLEKRSGSLRVKIYKLRAGDGGETLIKVRCRGTL